MSRPQTVEAYTAQRITIHANTIADSLDRLAGSVRQIAADPQPGRYAGIASQIQREVMSTLINLPLDRLTTLAAEAETANVRGE